MIPERYKCAHAFMMPGDGWMTMKEWTKVDTKAKPPVTRRMRIARCRLCKETELHVFEFGRWKPIEQLPMIWGGAPEGPDAA